MVVRGHRIALITALVIVIAAVGAGTSRTPHAGALPSRPNIVVILLDDLRREALSPSTMPTVHSEILGKGTTFSESFVTNPLCCPSRTTLLTGQYSHTTGVWTNEGPHGGFPAFDDDSTLPIWLDDVGYRTALVGKYMHQYQGPYVPPGWDRWVAFQRPGYFDYDLVIDGVTTSYGTHEAEYSTDVLADFADGFVRSVDANEPLFMLFAPTAPHAPAVPAPRHVSSFPDLEPWRPVSYSENLIEDKPAYIQARPRLRRRARAVIDTLRANQFRSLLSVDEAIAQILGALEDTGRLEETVLLFTSDNGLLWGEHRWDRKMVPYEESIRVSLAIRADGITPPGSVVDQAAVNVDLAPTLADLAGVEAPEAEGNSLVPLLAGTSVPWREDFVLEHVVPERPNRAVPTYCGVRSSEGFMYAVYSTGEVELYDLEADPHQLRNVAGRARYVSEQASLQSRAVALCDPLPPDFTFPPAG